MRNYGLYTKESLELLKKIKSTSLSDAIEAFADIKKLSKWDIVEIFEVKEIPE